MTINYCKRYDQRFAHLENTLNGLGYIPLVSTFSGAMRGAYGTIQSIFGNLGFFFRGSQYIVTRNPAHRFLAAENFWMGVHGILNAKRGTLEAIPLAGNIATFAYDHLFGLRANYSTENLHGKSPLFAHHTYSQGKSPFKEKNKI